jgi:predicted RNA-binding Zn-ribbon protein involved in translation (DUF1610 family)
MTHHQFHQAWEGYLAWKKVRTKLMRQIGGVTLIVGIPASLLGIFNAYPAWSLGLMSIPTAAIFTLAFQIDWKEKKVGLVCPKCGLRLAGAVPALKVLSSRNCPRCNFQIIAYNK